MSWCRDRRGWRNAASISGMGIEVRCSVQSPGKRCEEQHGDGERFEIRCGETLYDGRFIPCDQFGNTVQPDFQVWSRTCEA
ncbi:hypothetical protein BDY17DRAFT_136987 [Neohortaea acidophila]|uniref:Uncharacterized protein n=1 Tax=Neohortaea acidophila TaxID=245834 RepID=A0A6A6PUH7_9PEZI|nr:uncharacterized protein BDY17DRAFT_136987 [Neohortaea acidophila]KAF2482877.1 hypothetical protein BDY17DRAFT_136987 [Neohortaea acidophila]